MNNWTSKLGFILAAAGSAIGLGAIWKFPYTAGNNGGAVFFLLFLICTVAVALPVMLAEFYVGRKSGRNAVDAFKALQAGKWSWIGYLGVLSCFLILSFYSVVGGWILNYIVHSFSGKIHANADFGALFGETISNPKSVIFYQALFMAITIFVVKKGIARGIEKANAYLMPALFIMFLVLAVRSLTLPNAWQGVVFLLKPDLSYINSATFLSALGQAFFALSLGVSTMLTYASYLSEKEDLFGSAHSIMWMNIFISLLAGLVIFPAVFALNFEASQGPGLIFIVLPAVFQQIPLGTVLFAIFMILVSFATLTSAFSLLETVVAAVSRNNEAKREKFTLNLGVLILIFGIPSALSYGVLQDWKLFGKTIFDLLDYLTTSWFMPIGALATAIFVAWHQKKALVLEHVSKGTKINPKIVNFWYQILRWFAPVAIILIFIKTLSN